MLALLVSLILTASAACVVKQASARKARPLDKTERAASATPVNPQRFQRLQRPLSRAQSRRVLKPVQNLDPSLDLNLKWFLSLAPSRNPSLVPKDPNAQQVVRATVIVQAVAPIMPARTTNAFHKVVRSVQAFASATHSVCLVVKITPAKQALAKSPTHKIVQAVVSLMSSAIPVVRTTPVSKASVSPNQVVPSVPTSV